MRTVWHMTIALAALASSLQCAKVQTTSAGPDHGTAPEHGQDAIGPDTSAGAAAASADSLAHKLVTQIAPVHEGDHVMIVGGVREIEFMEDVAVQARRLGAFPLVAHRSERMARRMFDDVPAKWDSQMPEFTLKLATILDVHIELDFAESLSYLDGVPPERLAARWNANEIEDRIQRRRGMLMVHIGNEMYPSEERARLYGISKNTLAEMFWSALDVDYAKLQERGARLRQALRNGKEIHITHPNGTDLRVGIAGREIFVSDGVITQEDIRQGAAGGTGASAYLPAGEVYVVPVPNTAQGVVVDDYATVDVPGQRSPDRAIRNMRLVFARGAVTSKSADAGMEHYEKGYWNVVGPGRDRLSVVDFGFNPRIRQVPGGRLEVYSADGMVTLGLGNQQWAGSDNPASFGVRHYLPGCTVSVDGKVLIKDGELQ